MPADCTQTVEVAEVAAAPPGWAAAAEPLVWSDHRPRGPAESEEQRQAFAAHSRKRIAASRPVFPQTQYAPLRAAATKALREWERMVPLDLAHRLADQFTDPDCRAKEDAWLAARDDYDLALQAVLELDVSAAPLALEKVATYFAGHGITVDEPAQLAEGFVRDLDDHAEVVALSLWRDMRALAHVAPTGKFAELAASLRDAAEIWKAAPADASEANERLAFAHHTLLDEITATHPSTLQELAAKVRLLRSPEAEGALEEAETTARVPDLLNDILRLAGAPSTICPASRLMDEHEPVYAQADDEHPRSDGAYRVSCEYEERASWARARSLRGVIYQVALAVSRNSFLMANTTLPDPEEDVQRGLDHRYISRLLLSVLHYLTEQAGMVELSPMLTDYAGPHNHFYIDLLSDDPQPFDPADFARRFRAAGGLLRHQLNGDGSHGVFIVPPSDPQRLPEFLPVLADATRFEALTVYLEEVWGSYVNHRRDVAPADWDGTLAGAA